MTCAAGAEDSFELKARHYERESPGPPSLQASPRGFRFPSGVQTLHWPGLMPPVPPPDCPFLPEPPDSLDWRCLSVHGEDRGAAFYLSALQYGRYLWRQTLPARALLCLDRALGADLHAAEPVLRQWPLPYEAMAWFLRYTPAGVFVGNPRVHFQHYAGRMNEPRRDQRAARAWACWALARALHPEWPGDPRHVITEPSLDEIGARLDAHGLPGERLLWQGVLDGCAPVVSKNQ